MSAGAGYGTAVNIFAFGFILLPCLACWDYFIFTANKMMLAGYMDQDGMNTLYMLTIMMNGLAFLFLLASAYSLIVQAKSDANKGV
jgi:TRAP-type C4-dicarboxylate transport system permease small subunit